MDRDRLDVGALLPWFQHERSDDRPVVDRNQCVLAVDRRNDRVVIDRQERCVDEPENVDHVVGSRVSDREFAHAAWVTTLMPQVIRRE
jgi:hypothetical protein